MSGLAEQEFLDPLARIHLTRVEIAVRIHSSLMHPVKLSCVAPVVTEARNDSTVVAVENPDDIVFAISDQQILLPGVMREFDCPDGPVAEGRRMDEKFFYKLSLSCEYLNAVVSSVTNVHETVRGQAGTMHRGSKLTIERPTRPILR
jgi:hypothetical protein